jgi:hypothetical protein
VVWVQVKKIIEKKSQKSAPLWLHSNILGHWTFEKFFQSQMGDAEEQGQECTNMGKCYYELRRYGEVPHILKNKVSMSRPYRLNILGIVH